ncbi:MAG: Fic family protein [Muribaculaceae bacterium]|nr:Fic family protein [Muribaculaceae bacterium]
MTDIISVKEFALKHNISERTIRNYCASGKIKGAFLTGKTWNIPSDAPIPNSSRKRNKTTLLATLRDQMETKLKGGIYHRIQVDLTYNSNHIEGSKLSHDQTRFIFETNTIGQCNENLNIDDIIETTNHFRCIDLIIANVNKKLSERFIKELHKTLKSNTFQSTKQWFAVGDYKRMPNEVGGQDTTAPENVAQEITELLNQYNFIKTKSLDDILDFHFQFERIHPFQDGNGRIGRLIMFKECLANGIVPFIITDELKYFYYRGLQNWPNIKEFLRDTCLSAQDDFKTILDSFKIKY